MRTEMEDEDEPGIAVQDGSEVVFLTLGLDHNLIGVTLVRVEVQHGVSCKVMFWNMGEKQVH